MGQTVDVACFALKQEILLCKLVLLIVLLQEACILTGSVIASTVLSQSGKRIILVQGLLWLLFCFLFFF